jgi:hypothetical protein
MRWQDFIAGEEGAKRLDSLKTAVARMKSLDSSPIDSADYRRSWAYWANIHGYYGTQSPDGTVEQQVSWLRANGFASYVRYYQGVSDQTPPDAVAQAVWATCEHSSPPQQANFFGWHRLYLYYFERVLRWAANDDALRLPYWDYTDPAQLALPEAFRESSSPLYESRRNPRINSGAATLSGDSTDVDDLLQIADYFDYESRIERGIHGYVHCTVGPTCPVAHMGDVPLAGNDPVFYMHHANVDRLWACWQQLHGTPEGEWQEQEFSFVDETGAQQTEPVSFAVDSTALGYAYDNVSDCAREEPSALAAAPPPAATPAPTPAPATAPAEEDEEMVMLGASRGIEMERPQLSVDLDVPRPKLRGAMADLAEPGKVELVLRDVAAESHPGTSFDVFVARRGDPGSREHVGTISWFGAFRRRHGEEDKAPRTFRFDVTDELRDLGEAAAESGLTVVLEATDGMEHADPAQAEAMKRQAAEAFRPESDLRIGAIELHALPPEGEGGPDTR